MTHYPRYSRTVEALELLRDAEPDSTYLDEPREDDDDGDVEGAAHIDVITLPGCRARWLLPRHSYVVAIPAENLLVMEGNMWNFGHAAAVLDAMRERRGAFGVPAGRVYRIDRDDVRSTKALDEETLHYDYGLLVPWGPKDVSKLRAQLLDGNHRAIAALELGDPLIPVYVGENYREDITPREWIKA